MPENYGDVVMTTETGEITLKRDDVLRGLTNRWAEQGLTCESAAECLADVDTDTLIDWVLLSALGIMPICPYANPKLALMRALPEGIQN